ncbi:MAG: fatty acid CoA ligase family protein [Lentisphaeria bacterium]
MPSSIHNIAQLLNQQASEQPRSNAVFFPESRDAFGRVAYTHLTFKQLHERSDSFAWGMQALGVCPGQKALLMIRPSLDFYSLLFAIFKIGAVPVLIDPGMGWKNFLSCVRSMEPEVFLGIPSAHLLRLLTRRFFRSVKINITLGKYRFWGGRTIAELQGGEKPFPIHEMEPDDLAAVLFTSGSTGPAKGVSYTHRIFNTQVRLVQREYGIKPGEMDLACFPLFSLFSIALGASVVIPDMDPSKPASVNPERILEPIRNLPVTYSFGSPTLWDQVSRYACEKKIRLPGLRRVIMAGAPVPAQVHERLLHLLLDSGAETYTPYGATESLPIANFRGSEMLAETQEATSAGKGTCVGKPIPEIQTKIITISDLPIAIMQDAQELPLGETGELCVSGPCVTKEYYRKPEATRLAKIQDGAKVWHRVGDVGYFDRQGRFWFCGRKAHRVEIHTEAGKQQTLFSIPCEAIFNKLPGVKRSALVGIGKRPTQIPAIIIETEQNHCLSDSDILKTAACNPLTTPIRHVFFHPSFPVDVRHNAKINREELARWAAKKLKYPQ